MEELEELKEEIATLTNEIKEKTHSLKILNAELQKQEIKVLQTYIKKYAEEKGIHNDALITSVVKTIISCQGVGFFFENVVANAPRYLLIKVLGILEELGIVHIIYVFDDDDESYEFKDKQEYLTYRGMSQTPITRITIKDNEFDESIWIKYGVDMDKVNSIIENK